MKTACFFDEINSHITNIPRSKGEAHPYERVARWSQRRTREGPSQEKPGPAYPCAVLPWLTNEAAAPRTYLLRARSALSGVPTGSGKNFPLPSLDAGKGSGPDSLGIGQMKVDTFGKRNLHTFFMPISV